MIKNANELQEFITSVRKKAFEDVARLIKSDSVTKGDYDFLMIDAEDLIGLINSIDTPTLRQKRAGMKDEGEATFEASFYKEESDNLA